jgi:hypothetical protein
MKRVVKRPGKKRRKKKVVDRSAAIRRERARYGPGNEERRDRRLEAAVRLDVVALFTGEPLRSRDDARVVQVLEAALEVARQRFCGSSRLRRIGGPEELREIQRREIARPEASLDYPCYCEEPGGEGWADDD